MAAWLPPADIVVSSPLARARQTAAVFGHPITVDERWIERDYGSYDDGPPEALSPQDWARWRSDEAFTPDGIEPESSIRTRVTAACEELSTQAVSSVVIVVSHVSPIKSAIAWALGVHGTLAWRLYVEDAGVSRVDITEDGPVVRWFNRGGA
jgi:broad specificity phosphatase PhoE